MPGANRCPVVSTSQVMPTKSRRWRYGATDGRCAGWGCCVVGLTVYSSADQNDADSEAIYPVLVDANPVDVRREKSGFYLAPESIGQ